ncbi:MAG: AarF/ABC1/UbiB kinase family protein [Thermodesulfovibrionales bacterium]|nr:AarF/ABC1/UbiB kinase family protein [Thermodesulfovibrionales bacterium]
MEIGNLTRRFKSARRLQQIVNVFLKYGFGQIIDQIQLGRYIPFKRRLKTFGIWPALKGPTVPERLRFAFAELGPSFIKLAQLLASRPDLITVEYANEFKKLQDEVPPFEFESIKQIIEEELNKPLEKIFLDFNKTPIAAASIAQVHKALLHNGRSVAVKVQRPNIKEVIEADLNILNIIARLLLKYVPESRFFNPTGIVEEFSKSISKELNFLLEARNCLKFSLDFQNNPNVHFPEVYEEYTTEKVLVMEFVDGVRIDNIKAIDALNLDKKKISKTCIELYFKQILENGFFHADPHPGNILIRDDGVICFLDFGIVGRVSDELKDIIANTFIAIINRDFDRLIDQYIELGVVPEDIDIESFRREFKTDLRDVLEPLYGLKIRQIDFAQYMETLIRLATKYRLRIPSDLLLIDKTLLILENLIRHLEPDLDIIAEAEPYASRIVMRRVSPSTLYEKTKKNVIDLSDFLLFLPKSMTKLLKKALKDEIQVKMFHVNLPDFIKDMDKASNRIAFAMVVSSIILSSAIMHAAGVEPRIFGFSFLGLLAFGFAFFLGVWLIISIIRSGRL